jgi:hypothetical protein
MLGVIKHRTYQLLPGRMRTGFVDSKKKSHPSRDGWLRENLLTHSVDQTHRSDNRNDCNDFLEWVS